MSCFHQYTRNASKRPFLGLIQQKQIHKSKNDFKLPKPGPRVGHYFPPATLFVCRISDILGTPGPAWCSQSPLRTALPRRSQTGPDGWAAGGLIRDVFVVAALHARLAGDKRDSLAGSQGTVFSWSRRSQVSQIEDRSHDTSVPAWSGLWC